MAFLSEFLVIVLEEEFRQYFYFLMIEARETVPENRSFHQ